MKKIVLASTAIFSSLAGHATICVQGTAINAVVHDENTKSQWVEVECARTRENCACFSKIGLTDPTETNSTLIGTPDIGTYTKVTVYYIDKQEVYSGKLIGFQNTTDVDGKVRFQLEQ